MKLTKILTVAIPSVATVFLILNMIEKDYLAFYDPRELIPKNSHFAKALSGDTTGCITTPSQTKPVDMAQIKALKTAKTTRDAIAILGDAFCETSQGTRRYLTTNGKQLNLSFDKILDYDFSTSAKTTSVQPRVSAPIPRESKIQRKTLVNP